MGNKYLKSQFLTGFMYGVHKHEHKNFYVHEAAVTNGTTNSFCVHIPSRSGSCIWNVVKVNSNAAA